jgi:hypothetical protein
MCGRTAPEAELIGQLILHLGDCKTGSTALQAALAAGTAGITGRTICYPTGLDHNPLAQKFIEQRQGKTDGTPAREALRAIAARFADSTADYGILSAEWFEFTDPVQVHDALAAELGSLLADLRLVVYVRPHASRFQSMFAEIVKLGSFQGTIDQYLDRAAADGTFHYAPRLARWRRVWGDRLIVRPFLRDRMQGGDVTQDFLHVIGVGAPVQVQATGLNNTALGLVDLSVMRRLLAPRAGWSVPPRRLEALGRNFGHLLGQAEGADTTRLTIHRALRARLHDLYRADAKTIDTDWFGGPDGPMSAALDSLPTRGPPCAQSLDAADHLPPAVLTLIDGWAAILPEIILRDGPNLSWTLRDRPFRPTDMAAPPESRDAAWQMSAELVAAAARMAPAGAAHPQGKRIQTTAAQLMRRMARGHATAFLRAAEPLQQTLAAGTLTPLPPVAADSPRQTLLRWLRPGLARLRNRLDTRRS